LHALIYHQNPTGSPPFYVPSSQPRQPNNIIELSSTDEDLQSAENSEEIGVDSNGNELVDIDNNITMAQANTKARVLLYLSPPARLNVGPLRRDPDYYILGAI
jgi:hypothetical protein